MLQFSVDIPTSVLHEPYRAPGLNLVWPHAGPLPYPLYYQAIPYIELFRSGMPPLLVQPVSNNHSP